MRIALTILALTLCAVTALAQPDEGLKPFIGRWALTIPGGGAGWLEVTTENGYPDANILWGGGSVVPVASVGVSNGRLVVMRLNDVQRKNAQGEVVRVHQLPETLIGTVSGDTLTLGRIRMNENGTFGEPEEFAGKRIPDLPPAPDLSSLKFGEPITLFNGQNLDGWQLTNEKQVNGWSVQEGVLTNNPAQEEGKPHVSYGNLRTAQEFEDFNLTLEVNVPKGGNSGIYLRGIYEVQVMDSYGMTVDSHHMGGVYSRITPSYPAEKPAGEWQTMDITLADRHVTVKLNGITIINNQPLLGCTGGALWPDESRPGPIYLQGDHTGASYRNVVLKPVVK